jgi:hypothetical protein
MDVRLIAVECDDADARLAAAIAILLDAAGEDDDQQPDQPAVQRPHQQHQQHDHQVEGDNGRPGVTPGGR